jgi:hypothetical protein
VIAEGFDVATTTGIVSLGQIDQLAGGLSIARSVGGSSMLLLRSRHIDCTVTDTA